MRIFYPAEVIPQVFNLLVRRRFRFQFELIPYEATRLSRAKIGNLFLAGLNQYLRRPAPFGRPAFAQVEPANICNLSCPLCLTVSQTQARPPALLPLQTFQQFIDDLGAYLLLVVLWNWGEPLLNPDLPRMIAYAHERGVLTHCSTNGNFPITAGLAEELVRSGLDTLIFGVDGATEETYQAYRCGGSLAEVKRNIAALLEARRRLGASTPRVNLRFVVMKQNESELPQVTAMARELGVDHLTLKTVDLPADIGADLDGQWAPEEQKFKRYEYLEGSFRRKRRRFNCVRPWKRITLDAAGTVIACEFDYRNLAPFGVVGRDGTATDIWKGPAGREFRRGFRGGWNEHPFCAQCTLKHRVARDCTVARIF